MRTKGECPGQCLRGLGKRVLPRSVSPLSRSYRLSPQAEILDSLSVSVWVHCQPTVLGCRSGRQAVDLV